MEKIGDEKWVERIFNDSVDNIASIKKQEWIVSGYAIAIDGAVMAVRQQYILSDLAKLCLVVAVAGAAVIGVAILLTFGRALGKFRHRIDTLYADAFSEKQLAHMRLGKNERVVLNEVIFIGGLSLSLLFGACIAGLVVYAEPAGQKETVPAALQPPPANTPRPPAATP